MRSEEEMMALIMDFVAADPNIRVAVLIGSRANPSVKKDIFQDYDIGCYVANVDAYKTGINIGRKTNGCACVWL